MNKLLLFLKRLWYLDDDIYHVFMRYKMHANKFFIHWDLINCGLPQTFSNNFETKTVQNFDLVIIKDVIQHIPINGAKQMLKNVADSGARYLLVTSYKCDPSKVNFSKSW